LHFKHRAAERKELWQDSFSHAAEMALSENAEGAKY
jgi:hypothetical protein